MSIRLNPFTVTNEKDRRETVEKRRKTEVQTFEQRVESILQGKIRTGRSLSAVIFQERETS